MFYVRKIFLFCIVHNISVICLIPSLNVQKLDRKLIEMKRQDTLDLCRMFTEENNRMQHSKTDVSSHNFINNRKRVKRDLQPANSSINFEEAKRIESIVDKLYDEMTLNGKPVTYRQRELPATVKSSIVNMTGYSIRKLDLISHAETLRLVNTPTNVITAPTRYSTPAAMLNQSARRFEFAPAELLPPVPTKQLTSEDVNNIKYPWVKKWKHGIVPFFIDSNTYDAYLSKMIVSAFDNFEKSTCIRLQRLRERPTDKESLQNVEWLYITNPSGIRQCVHSNERKENKGVQMVVFGYDCLSVGEIVHEIMHILGFSHEHTRPDRDQYITILWDNIKPGYKKYFEIRVEDPLASLPYDYSSVLHYPSRAFSKNGQVTLLTQPGIKVGQREGLSDVDITKVTTIYGSECIDRNREYLLKTCPSVVKLKNDYNNVTQEGIEDYFKERLWPYGIVNYKIKDKMEFSIEERENIDAVIRHIEKETCIEFRDLAMFDIEEKAYSDNQDISLDKEENKNVQANDIDSEKSDIITDNEIDTNATQGSENEITKDVVENRIDVRKRFKIISDLGLNASESSYTYGNLPKSKIPLASKKALRNPGSQVPIRRHAESTLILARSLEPGCECPSPGKPNGEQIIKINADCFNSVNELLHLFVHVLGLDHQHNMHDRDSYLHILWDNLTPEISEEMKKKLPAEAAVGFPYDYQSVMHYPWLQIKNGVTNIMYPIWNDGWAMGHWQGLSSTDVNKLNLIYSEQCSLRKQHATK